MHSLVVCGVFSGCGALLLLLRSQADSLLYKTCGLFALIMSILYSIVVGKEMLAEGASVWRLVAEYVFGLALMPAAALIGTMQRRRRQKKGS